MFVRFVTFKSLPDKVDELRDFFNTEVFAGLQQTPGCLFASLIESAADPNEFSSLTLWESSDHIRAYEDGGRFAAFVQAAEPFLAESGEWQLQLSKDLTLEYKPVVEEPQAASYRLYAVMDGTALDKNRAADMHLRLVRLRAREDGLEALTRHYLETVIPALRKVQGCRNALLMGNVEAGNELIAVTVWDRAQDAEAYDRGPVFQSLINEQRELMSAHIWQTTLKSDLASKVYTSDKVTVQSYKTIARQGFGAQP
jgi:quinol monooxygenase YgiN